MAKKSGNHFSFHPKDYEAAIEFADQFNSGNPYPGMNPFQTNVLYTQAAIIAEMGLLEIPSPSSDSSSKYRLALIDGKLIVQRSENLPIPDWKLLPS